MELNEKDGKWVRREIKSLDVLQDQPYQDQNECKNVIQIVQVNRGGIKGKRTQWKLASEVKHMERGKNNGRGK